MSNGSRWEIEQLRIPKVDQNAESSSSETGFFFCLSSSSRPELPRALLLVEK